VEGLRSDLRALPVALVVCLVEKYLDSAESLILRDCQVQASDFDRLIWLLFLPERKLARVSVLAKLLELGIEASLVESRSFQARSQRPRYG
jgi:hypothetical protein